MSAVETGFKWAERWALTHWMFTSLGGGAMLGAILEIATGIPLELTIVFSAAISLAAMLVLSVINLLKAQARMADAKRLHYSRLHTETLNHRRARIAACRTIVSGWDGDHSHTAQRDKLLRDENFLAIRKHLSSAFEGHMAFKGAAIISEKTLGVPLLMAFFAKELDRLEGEWNLD